MRTIHSLLPLPLVALATSPAAAQERTATAQEAWDGIQACEAITESGWIHLDRLPDRGWEVAERRAARRSARKVRGIYEKDGNQAYVLIGREELKDKRCVVLAGLESTAGYSAILQGLSGIIGMPDSQDGFAYTWNRPGFTLLAEPAGTADEPSARFTTRATDNDKVEPAQAAPVAQASEIDTSSSDGILAALKACIPAMTADGFAGNVLTDAGWVKSEAELASGGTVDLFEADGNDVLITSGSSDQAGKLCLVRSTVDEGATIDNIRAAMTGLYGTPEADENDLYWVHEGRVFYLMTNFEEGAEGPFAVQIPVSYVGETE